MSRGQSAFPLYLHVSLGGDQGGIFASPFILKKYILKFVNTSAFCEHLLSIGKNLKWIICTVITTAAIHQLYPHVQRTCVHAEKEIIRTRYDDDDDGTARSVCAQPSRISGKGFE